MEDNQAIRSQSSQGSSPLENYTDSSIFKWLLIRLTWSIMPYKENHILLVSMLLY
jgi:hypothetical protein